MFLFQDFAIEVIKTTHGFWKALISKQACAGELNWYKLHHFDPIYVNRTSQFQYVEVIPLYWVKV